jgi:hypothetical protein
MEFTMFMQLINPTKGRIMFDLACFFALILVGADAQCQQVLIGPEIGPTSLYGSTSTNGFLYWDQTGMAQVTPLSGFQNKTICS